MFITTWIIAKTWFLAKTAAKAFGLLTAMPPRARFGARAANRAPAIRRRIEILAKSDADKAALDVINRRYPNGATRDSKLSHAKGFVSFLIKGGFEPRPYIPIVMIIQATTAWLQALLEEGMSRGSAANYKTTALTLIDEMNWAGGAHVRAAVDAFWAGAARAIANEQKVSKANLPQLSIWGALSSNVATLLTTWASTAMREHSFLSADDVIHFPKVTWVHFTAFKSTSSDWEPVWFPIACNCSTWWATYGKRSDHACVCCNASDIIDVFVKADSATKRRMLDDAKHLAGIRGHSCRREAAYYIRCLGVSKVIVAPLDTTSKPFFWKKGSKQFFNYTEDFKLQRRQRDDGVIPLPSFIKLLKELERGFDFPVDPPALLDF